MRITTTSERNEAVSTFRAEMQRLRAAMTPEQLVRVRHERHQGERERERRLRRLKLVSD